MQDDWLVSRTGIESRAACGPEQNALSLAADVLSRLLIMRGLAASDLGRESAVIYIHNSLEQGTPPAGIRLCAALGLRTVRSITMEGVCAEVIQGIELADSLLLSGHCQRVFLLASANYAPLINASDPASAGLFGAGAGGILLERSTDPKLSGLRGTCWHTDTSQAGLGELQVHSWSHEEGELLVRASLYSMDGERLAREVLASVPRCFTDFVQTLAWDPDKLDAVISHQPNLKLLRLLGRRMGLTPDRLPDCCSEIGNLGPASLLVGLSQHLTRSLEANQRVVLLGFGLGFCCGCAAFESA